MKKIRERIRKAFDGEIFEDLRIEDDPVHLCFDVFNKKRRILMIRARELRELDTQGYFVGRSTAILRTPETLTQLLTHLWTQSFESMKETV
jgi:tRNA U54 and U55 pseudouridine synthase Pus10